jgi:hypothetical protein
MISAALSSIGLSVTSMTSVSGGCLHRFTLGEIG